MRRARRCIRGAVWRLVTHLAAGGRSPSRYRPSGEEGTMRMDALDDARWRKPDAGKRAASRQELPLTPEMIASLRADAVSAHRAGTGCGVTGGLLAAACLA